MQIKRTLSEKGQIVVPKDIREYLGLKPGSEIVFEIRDDEIVIKLKKDPKKFVEEFCDVPKKLKKPIDVKKLLEKQIEEEYDIR
ncbi:MAG: AbrB/MazE/SpoVT family DNA-binding domain-containing protein [archaeon]|nr:AbrB/MazE/SpoVT family DNA-binding domain-containing protein [archaeon]